jgi:hypothetical protein
MMKLKGQCHCGTVAFEVQTPAKVTVYECNCSICSMQGFLHLIVPKKSFTLLSGGENLTTYTFNTGVAQHTFCKTCGVKPFYTPRSNPEGVSVNWRCVSKEEVEDQISDFSIEPFDGQHWDENAARLRHLSND